MTAPARQRQADLTRIFKALKAADLPAARVTIDPGGKIDVYFGPAAADSAPANPLDRVLEHGRQG